MGLARGTQVVTEILLQTPGKARLTQQATEIVVQGGGEVRISLVALEVLRSIGGDTPPPEPGGSYRPIIICTL